MNSNETKTAAEFSMRDNSSSPFAWIMEGSSPEALAASPSTEQFVRDYVRGCISAQYDYKASDATIYKVWRSQSGEFQAIVDYIQETRHMNSSETIYEIDCDLIGDSEPATKAQVQEIIDAWEPYEGWRLELEASDDELRLYAYRDGDEDNNSPSRYTSWIMVTDDYGYIVIGRS